MADDSWAKLTRRLSAAMAPHSGTIESIWDDGKIAVLVVDPSEEARDALVSGFGWDGQSAVFPLTDSRRLRMGALSRESGDIVTHAWLTEHRTDPRVLVFIDAGTLLLNLTARGWSLEPNSTGGQGLT